jgi:hypothetical protein
MTNNFAYEVTGPGSDLFGVINLNTGVFTPIGSMGLTLAGIGNYNGVIYGGAYHGNTLYSVNTSTGALTGIGTGNISYADFGYYVWALCLRRQRGSLFNQSSKRCSYRHRTDRPVLWRHRNGNVFRFKHSISDAE